MDKFAQVIVVPAGGRAYCPQYAVRDERDMTAWLTAEDIAGVVLVEPKWTTQEPLCRD